MTGGVVSTTVSFATQLTLPTPLSATTVTSYSPGGTGVPGWGFCVTKTLHFGLDTVIYADNAGEVVSATPASLLPDTFEL